jgi:hypothetical protein
MYILQRKKTERNFKKNFQEKFFGRNSICPLTREPIVAKGLSNVRSAADGSRKTPT